jgi:hypothetical protein
MYKVKSRIVLALRSPSGLSLEIIGGGQQRQEVGDRGDKDMEKVTPVPKLQLPLGGRAKWKVQCKVPGRILLSREFHILILGWLSSEGKGPPRL